MVNDVFQVIPSTPSTSNRELNVPTYQKNRIKMIKLKWENRMIFLSAQHALEFILITSNERKSSFKSL